MRARRTPERGPGRLGTPVRGGRAGHGSGVARPGDVPARLQVQPRLGPFRRGRAWPRRAAPVPPARPGDRGLELDQRDDLPSRSPRRLRRLGGAWLHGLVLRRGAPVLQAVRGQRAGCRRVPRRRGASVGVRQPLHVPVHRGGAGSRGRGRVHAHRGPERRRARGGLALPAHAAERHALQLGGRVPPSGFRQAESRGSYARLRRAHRLRGRPCRRRRARLGQRARDGARGTRGHRLGRRVPVARAAHALRDRTGPGSRVLRDPGAPGSAGRREPAGSLHGQRQLSRRTSPASSGSSLPRTSRSSTPRGAAR